MQVLSEPHALVSQGKIMGRSPLTGEELPPVAVSSHDDVLRAIARAREAQGSWAEHSPADRATHLKDLKGALIAHAPKLAKVMREELGKSLVESYTSEIIPSADLFGYWAKEGPKLLTADAKSLNPINFPAKTGVLEYAPKGVVALIAPWNFPVAIALRTIVPALAAGNTVVLKPSEFAPRTGAELARIFAEFPVPHVVEVVQGGGGVGAHLIESNVDHVVFTGSVNTGRKVASECSDRLLSYSLELGGKDAAIVLEDADLERAADGIVWGAFMNAGQNCASIERVYVVESVAQRFTDLVIERAQALTLGDSGGEDYDVGPLVRPEGLALVEAHVRDAIEQGATLRVGGKATGKGLHFLPTVLTDVDDDMAVMTDETFGPVLPIATVRDEQEAIARTNQSVFGLTASVWSQDIERSRRLAKRLNTGVVTINNHGFTAALPHAPWHGRGHSGHGITNSRFAFYDLVDPRYVLVDRNRGKELWWFPHTKNFRELAQAMAGALAGDSRVRAVGRVLKLMPKRWKS